MPLLWYTTVPEMHVTLPNVTSATNATSAHLCSFAQRAESVVNAKIGKVWNLPFNVASPYPILHYVATNLACYEFLSRRVFTSERANKSEWPDKFKEAMDILDQLVSGEMVLLDASGAVVPTNTSGRQVWSNTMNYNPTMTEDDAELMVVDEDKVMDIRDDRQQFVDGPRLL